MSGYSVKHSDIVFGKCEMCHITTRGTGVPIKVYADAHLVVLSGLLDESAYSVMVSIKDIEGRENRSETVKITPVVIGEFLVNNSARPVISTLRLSRVDVRIFTEAVVEWETDKFAESTVEYGLTEKYGTQVTSPYFIKAHRMKLPGLKSGKVYHYRVKSIDPFGNSTVSADMTIDTSKTFGPPGPGAGPGPEFKSIKFVKFAPEGGVLAPAPQPVIIPDKRVGVIITTNTRVKATLEIAKQPDPTKKHNEWELKDLMESGMKVCYECHKVDTSHPVNIPARRVPAELPTAEGRVMICITCHRPHGGDIDFMMRYDQKNKICVLCHTNM